MNTITEAVSTPSSSVARIRENQTDTRSTNNFNGTYGFPRRRPARRQLRGRKPGHGICFPPTCFNEPAGSGPARADEPEFPAGLSVHRDPPPSDNRIRCAKILNAGCGPTSYSENAGPSIFAINQFDAGVFAQDDWRFRPNITISGGLRYEMQTNIADKADLAPRLAVSWSPGGKAWQTEPARRYCAAVTVSSTRGSRLLTF